MSPLSDRPTPDVVLLILTLVVALSVLLIGAGIFVLAALHPEYDISEAFSSLGQVIGLMIGSVLGYLAGKGRSPVSREK